jgi:Ser/Thr protein kinase RdoA (MazF antagonist)
MMNPDELCAWLAVRYDGFRPLECRLLRSYTNDVYLVRLPDKPCVLKVYGSKWRTASEIRYEVALLQHLTVRDLPIAAPLAANDDDFVGGIPSVGGYRHAVLFEYAPGEKPQPPFTPQLYFAFGRAVAVMHELSSTFVTPHWRRPLDLNHLIDEPVTQVAPLLEQQEDRAFVIRFARQLKARIRAFAAAGLDWGPIHGDATLDNLHVTANGEVVLYDFDSGGPGWRAADLQGWAVGNRAYDEQGDAFQRGYASIRRLDRINILAAPYLTLAWAIWGLKIDLDHRVLKEGRERTREYLRDQLALLRTRSEQISLWW